MRDPSFEGVPARAVVAGDAIDESGACGFGLRS